MFAAPPPRANRGSLDPATAIAVAPSVRSNFREIFMLSSLALKAGNRLKLTSVLYSRILRHAAFIFKAAERSIPFLPHRPVRKSRHLRRETIRRRRGKGMASCRERSARRAKIVYRQISFGAAGFVPEPKGRELRRKCSCRLCPFQASRSSI